MKVTVSLDNVVVELEGDSVKTLFEQVASVQEAFGDLTCQTKDGSKSSDKVKLQVREVDGNKFYELVCIDRTQPELNLARRHFGVNKTGNTIFKKGNWVKYDHDKKEEVEI